MVDLFSCGDATDVSYINTCAAETEGAQAARENCEALWKRFEPYADGDFATEFCREFDARYWEMYLTVYFLEAGYDVCCPKPGPDVGIIFNRQRIWFEATTPTSGNGNSPDSVPEMKSGDSQETSEMQKVQQPQIILRYLNSIKVKFDQYKRWIKNKTINENDIFIIAINAHRINFDRHDTNPPRIIRTAYGFGDKYIDFDPETGSKIGSGYMLDREIKKNNGEPVDTGVFHRDEYTALSGLLCSRINVANQPQIMGADFQLAPNPRAMNRLPDDFRLAGTYFRPEITDNRLRIVRE